jgi:hypothetical protein
MDVKLKFYTKGMRREIKKFYALYAGFSNTGKAAVLPGRPPLSKWLLG